MLVVPGSQEVRRQAEDQNIKVFILRMKNARHLDASTVLALENLHGYLRQTDRHLMMAELPLASNVQFMTVMATNMPFIGRG